MKYSSLRPFHEFFMCVGFSLWIPNMSFYSCEYPSHPMPSESSFFGTPSYSHPKSSREPGLSLFQSLEEYSCTVAPHNRSPYQCLPSSTDALLPASSAHQFIHDIWSQDTRSSHDSREHRLECGEASDQYGPTDYSQFLQEHAPPVVGHNWPLKAHGRVESRSHTDQSVVLCLSALIK